MMYQACRQAGIKYYVEMVIGLQLQYWSWRPIRGTAHYGGRHGNGKSPVVAGATYGAYASFLSNGLARIQEIHRACLRCLRKRFEPHLWNVLPSLRTELGSMATNPEFVFGITPQDTCPPHSPCKANLRDATL